MRLLDGTVRLSRLRPVSGVNHVAPTRLAVGKASLDPLRSGQHSKMGKFETKKINKNEHNFLQIFELGALLWTVDSP